jgi:hypothetical protein
VAFNTQQKLQRGGGGADLEASAMNICPVAAACLATLAGCSTVAPGTPPHTALSQDDVSFYEYSFEQKPHVWNNATCGFMIQGNSYSWQVPRPEWAISVYEVMDKDTPVVRVEAAAFRVVSNDRKAPVETRPPITAMTFMLKGRGEPLTANIVGEPNGLSGEINATLETAPAQGLFKALSWGKPIEVSLTYQDGATDMLEVRNWYVARDFYYYVDKGRSYLDRGPEGDYFHECLKSLRPGPAGVRYVVNELGPLPIISGSGFKPANAHAPGPIGWWTPPGSFCFGPHGEPGTCPMSVSGEKP